jgi:DNA-binding response OmpR family regulator
MPQEAPRILIVDDEPDTCANLSDIMTDLGYQVDTALDGFSALELVKRKPYDIALLDLRMPGMDGLELYRRIRAISAGTVAIIVTAYTSSDMAKSVLSAGAWQIVRKPVNIGSLLNLFSQALSSPSRP